MDNKIAIEVLKKIFNCEIAIDDNSYVEAGEFLCH